MEIFAYHQEIHRNKRLMEEASVMAFVEDIKQKTDLAKNNYINLTGETVRLFYNFIINVSSTLRLSQSNVTR
jgi:hypothetical protein